MIDPTDAGVCLYHCMVLGLETHLANGSWRLRGGWIIDGWALLEIPPKCVL